jgi:hypothetical protein
MVSLFEVPLLRHGEHRIGIGIGILGRLPPAGSIGKASFLLAEGAMGMSRHGIHNHSDLTLSAQALVTSESNSPSVG